MSCIRMERTTAATYGGKAGRVVRIFVDRKSSARVKYTELRNDPWLWFLFGRAIGTWLLPAIAQFDPREKRHADYLG